MGLPPPPPPPSVMNASSAFAAASSAGTSHGGGRGGRARAGSGGPLFQRTSFKGERESLYRRTYPPSWWQRAVELALNASARAHALDDDSWTPSTSDRAAGQSRTTKKISDPLIVVHTNSVPLANATFGPMFGPFDAAGGGAWAARGLSLAVRGADTPLLSVLHELIFCCNALVVGTSALSSAAALTTLAEGVYGRTPRDIHFLFKYRMVPH